MSGRRVACSPCRKLRIGCDAVLRNGGACSNCLRRGKKCHVEGGQQSSTESARRSRKVLVRSISSPQAASITSASSTIQSTSSDDSRLDLSGPASTASTAVEIRLSPASPCFRFEQRTCRRQQALSLHQILWDIFVTVYEDRFTMWLSENCCPFVHMTTGSNILISRLALHLDGVPDPDELTHHERMEYKITNDALMHAIYAFSARWLPLLARGDQPDDKLNPVSRVQDVVTHLWRQARCKVQRVMSRPSYRAVCALQVFGVTEQPRDCDDPGFNNLCTHVQIAHIHQLRSKAPSSLSFPLSSLTKISSSGSPEQQHLQATGQTPARAYVRPPPPTSTSTTSSTNKTPTDVAGDSRQHFEDVIFWLCAIKEVSNCLLRRAPQLLLQHASEDRKLWDFVRQRTVIFQNAFQTLHRSPQALPAEVLTIVLQHASACKVMYLSVVNRFYDALHFHNVPDTLEEAAQKVAMEAERFHDVFNRLLAICVRDFLTLDERSQVNYVWLIMHYYLGTLALAEILQDVEKVPSCLKSPYLSRLYACRAIVNALSLGLQADRHAPGDRLYGSRFLLDPIPGFQVQVLSLTGSAIFLLYETKEISAGAARAMLSVVVTVLKILSHVSTAASLAVVSLTETSLDIGLPLTDDYQYIPPVHNPETAAVLAVCDREFADGFLEEMKIQVYADDSIVDTTVQRYEDVGGCRRVGEPRRRETDCSSSSRVRGQSLPEAIRTGSSSVSVFGASSISGSIFPDLTTSM